LQQGPQLAAILGESQCSMQETEIPALEDVPEIHGQSMPQDQLTIRQKHCIKICITIKFQVQANQKFEQINSECTINSLTTFRMS
jgi:hypothetical protein